MRQIPKTGELWRHYKNQEYIINCIAYDEETGSARVIYRVWNDTDDPIYFDRELHVFMSLAPRDKGTMWFQTFRFEKVQEAPNDDT